MTTTQTLSPVILNAQFNVLQALAVEIYDRQTIDGGYFSLVTFTEDFREATALIMADVTLSDHASALIQALAHRRGVKAEQAREIVGLLAAFQERSTR